MAPCFMPGLAYDMTTGRPARLPSCESRPLRLHHQAVERCRDGDVMALAKHLEKVGKIANREDSREEMGLWPAKVFLRAQARKGFWQSGKAQIANSRVIDGCRIKRDQGAQAMPGQRQSAAACA